MVFRAVSPPCSHSFIPIAICFLRNKKNMFSFVTDLIRRCWCTRIRCFQIKSVIFLLCLNICLKFSSIAAGPTSQQQQELLLLEALSKRQPSYYGTSNSIMDILGRSMYRFVDLQLWVWENSAFETGGSRFECVHACAHVVDERTTRNANAFENATKIGVFVCVWVVIVVDCVWIT